MIRDKKILLVDDDPAIRNMLEVILRKEQFQNIYKAMTGADAIRISQEIEPDMIVLDIMLPDMDGYEVCRNIRLTSMAPILFLSAKSDEVDKLVSYAMGGDDYITKPFSPKELVARITAVLKRQEFYHMMGKKESNNQFSFGAFTIDFDKKLLLQGETEVPLTAKEYAILEYLVRNRNITVSRDKLVENVWDSDYDGFDNTVMVHIRHLREKVEADPSNPIYIRTVKGRGYVFSI